MANFAQTLGRHLEDVAGERLAFGFRRGVEKLVILIGDKKDKKNFAERTYSLDDFGGSIEGLVEEAVFLLKEIYGLRKKREAYFNRYLS